METKDTYELLVGIDDTDTLNDPGTNQLARHLVQLVSDVADCPMITRHQLLIHPLVPYTKKNGCAAFALKVSSVVAVELIIARLKKAIVDWCPIGSDPGLAVASSPLSQEILVFGKKCQQRVVTRQEAIELAAENSVFLEGLGGTNDGIIGALAAIGLLQNGNDGRVVYMGRNGIDLCEISGIQSVETIFNCGVAEVRCIASNSKLLAGMVDLGKRLRPNYRDGKVVLYARSESSTENSFWITEKVI
jgi:hypothetical protein